MRPSLDDFLRKEFPEAFFYTMIEERRERGTTIPKLDISLETIDKVFKHGF